MLTAEEKIRQRLSGNPFIDPQFRHEGDDVVRWLTGGIAPSVHVKLGLGENETRAYCPICNQELGRFDAAYGPDTASQLRAIRDVAHQHQRHHE